MSAYLLSSSLTPADVGRRVVVRWSLPDGRATDVLGELEQSTATELAVRRRDGSVELVPIGAVLAGKVVEARWARDMASGALQRIASDGWPALERVALGSWELRAAAGVSKRANSVLPLGSPGVPLEPALATIRTWYDDRGLTARVQVPLPREAGLDAELERRGWLLEDVSDVLVADLRTIPRGAGIWPDVTVEDQPSARWMTTTPLPASAAALRLLGGGNCVFASVLSGSASGAVAGEAVAGARGSLDAGWLGISVLNVAAAHRRQGHAQRLVSALAGWADERGARHAYLQVAQDNAAALPLYEKLGFTRHHSYGYRVAP